MENMNGKTGRKKVATEMEYLRWWRENSFRLVTLQNTNAGFNRVFESETGLKVPSNWVNK
jgi:hypothetical protein